MCARTTERASKTSDHQECSQHWGEDKTEKVKCERVVFISDQYHQLPEEASPMEVGGVTDRGAVSLV